jgi:hypothetical protein
MLEAADRETVVRILLVIRRGAHGHRLEAACQGNRARGVPLFQPAKRGAGFCTQMNTLREAGDFSLLR